MENPHCPIKLENNLWMVPCRLDPVSKKFVPLDDPSESQIKSYQKCEWSESEDRLLEDLVSFKGSKKWTFIAKKINDTFHDGANFRIGKHCRERWLNHLDPHLNKGEWSPEEDQMIFIQQEKIGNKWSVISKFLPGRTENQVKNRWKSIWRKAKKVNQNGGGKVRVEWGGEKGSGEGADCGDVSEFENCLEVEVTFCEQKGGRVDCYEYIESPSYFIDYESF